MNHAGKIFGIIWENYLFPASLKKFAIALSIQQLIHAGLGLSVYPSGQSILIDTGVLPDAATAALPAQMPVFVRPAPQERTWTDHLYALSDFPTIFGAAYGLKKSFSYSSGHVSATLVNISCDISMPSLATFDAREFISAIALIEKSSVRDMPLPSMEYFKEFFGHELGHCGIFQNPLPMNISHAMAAAEKIGLPSFTLKTYLETFGSDSELHSDIVSIDLTRSEDVEELKKYKLYLRAVTSHFLLLDKADAAHDLGLSLSAVFENIAAPSQYEISSSRREIATYVRKHYEDKTGKKIRDDFEWRDLLPRMHKTQITSNRSAIAIIRAVRNFLDDPSVPKSAHARKRGELYLEGMNYFAPAVVAQALKTPAPKPALP